LRLLGRQRDAELGLALAEIPAPVEELGASLLGVDQRPMQQREVRGDRFGRGGALDQRRGAHRKGDGHHQDGRHCAGADA